MKRFFRAGVLVWAGIAAAAIADANAAVVYSNLGPGDSYNSSTGYTVAFNFTVAGSFTPSANSTLDSVDLGFNYNAFSTPNGKTASVSLVADNAGVPGTLIEQLGNAVATSPHNTTGSGAVTATSTVHSSLLAGTTYWIVLSSGAGNDDVWKYNTTSDVNRGATMHASDGWIVGGSNPAFRVNATLPEPTALAPLAFAVVISRRRRPTGSRQPAR